MFPVKAGRIELVCGPMFAGKTTEMLRRVNRAELAHLKCVIMKYSKDTRYSQENVSTHDLEMRKAIPCCELLPYVDICLGYDFIGVDEGQFFPDVVEFAETMANHGKTVVVAALDGTFQRLPFGSVLQLISRSESITKLTAVCTETGGEAPYSYRKIASKEVEVIGGSDIYRAASRAAYFDIKNPGEIHLTIGPVQSGKTTELIRVLNRHYIANRKTICLRPSSIGEFKKKLNFEYRLIDQLPTIDSLSEYQVVGIDEAQKFTGLADWADQLANSGKIVIVSALEGDSDRKAFPEIVQLFPRCEKVEKLDSVCPITGLPAPFNILARNQISMIPISRSALIQQHLV